MQCSPLNSCRAE